MRRRRHKLEVSTFPFLAVLLCAMGSLILLLLVIDRRAKAVARAKAIAAAQRLEAADAQAAAARAAELERRRQALHAVLENQARDVRGKIDTLQKQSHAAIQLLKDERDTTKKLETRLAAESARLAQRQALLSARKTVASEQTQLSDAAKKEMDRLAVELSQLDQTLQALKELRKRETQMFSVVPYKGKRGDNRKPIYVECTEEGLVFHPDRKVLADLSPSGQEIRDEVNHRLDQMRASNGNAQARASETAYLLMLLRPNGIKTYYHALAALSGLKVDFGYEFIENDWVLDFPSDNGPLRTQPWMTAQQDATPAPPAGPAQHIAAKGVPRAGVHGVDFSGNMAMGVGGSATGVQETQHRGTKDIEEHRGNNPTGGGGSGMGGAISEPVPGLGQPMPASFPTKAGGAGVSVVGAGLGPAQPGRGYSSGSSQAAGTFAPATEVNVRRGGFPAGSAAGPGRADPANGGPTSNVATLPGGYTPAGGVNPSGHGTGAFGQGVSPNPGQPTPGSLSAAAGPSTTGAFGPPGAGGATGATVAGIGIAGTGGFPAGVGQGTLGSTGAPSGGTQAFSASADSGSYGATQNSSTGAAGGSVAGQGNPAGGAAASAMPGGQPAGGTQVALLAGNAGSGGATESGAATGSPSAGRPRGFLPGGVPADAGEPGDGLSSGVLSTLMPPAARKKPKGVPAVKRRPLNLNRDWHIPLECRADGVTILITQQHFTLEEVAQVHDNPLLLAVKQMIDRRQARVPEGELPYRPLLRFQVKPDGLRAYYLAYPMLDYLNIPMMREDCEPESVIRR